MSGFCFTVFQGKASINDKIAELLVIVDEERGVHDTVLLILKYIWNIPKKNCFQLKVVILDSWCTQIEALLIDFNIK